MNNIINGYISKLRNPKVLIIGGIIGIIIQVFCLIKIYSFVYAIYDDKQESEETIIAILSSIIPIIFLLKGSTYFGKTPKYRY